MDTYKVRDANRKRKRDIQKVFGDSFLKIITEIVLNSDDSYNRISEQNKQVQKTFGKISIFLDRKKRQIRVLDQAEGMSIDKIRHIFSEYGGDYSGGDTSKNIRGLFGQGASDVLFLSAFHKYPSFVISVRNNEASKCRFVFKKEKTIEIDAIQDVDKTRQETGIIQDGTLVVFGLPENIKIPKLKEIKKKIESFYMLRYILSSKDRIVAFYDGELKHRLDSSKYRFDKRPVILDNHKITLHFDGQTINSFLTLYEKRPIDRMNIIIRDEHHIVYEETLFGLDRIHGVNHIAGEYVIEGIGSILRKYLNKEKPEEILRDSRDGFDRRHRLTSEIIDQVSSVLYTVIEQRNAAREKVRYSLNNNKKIFGALQEVNRYFHELELSQISNITYTTTPPPKGIRFAREMISITKNKLYALQLYINTAHILPEEAIIIELEDNPYIEVKETILHYLPKDINQSNIAIKELIIKAKKITDKPIVLHARTTKLQTSVMVQVIKQKVVYPENGLAFRPTKKTFAPGKTSHISIYFDTNQIPLTSSVLVNQHYESMLFPDSIEYYTKEEHLITDTIGVIKVPIDAHDYEETIDLTATSHDILANATCLIKESNDQHDGYTRLLQKIELHFDDQDWQVNMDRASGLLQINGSHIINRKNMGDLGHKDPLNPIFDDQQLHYLYELLARETSSLYVTNKYKDEDNQPSLATVFKEVQEHKTKVYRSLIKKISMVK